MNDNTRFASASISEPRIMMSRRQMLSGAAGAITSATGVFAVHSTADAQIKDLSTSEVPISDNAEIVLLGKRGVSQEIGRRYIFHELRLAGDWMDTEFVHALAWGNGTEMITWMSWDNLPHHPHVYKLIFVNKRPHRDQKGYYCRIGLEKAPSDFSAAAAVFRYKKDGCGGSFLVSATTISLSDQS